MSSKKTISINPDLFKVGKKKNNTANKSVKRGRKPKPRSDLIKPNTLKKNLLQRIKDHQKRESVRETEERAKQNAEEIAQEMEKDKDFSRDFKETLLYLDQLSKNKRERKKNRKSRMRQHQSHGGASAGSGISNSYSSNSSNVTNRNIPQSTSSNEHMTISTELPNTLRTEHAPGVFHNKTMKIAPAPPYGVLKGGTKPLYREWKNKTMKRASFSTPNHSVQTARPIETPRVEVTQPSHSGGSFSGGSFPESTQNLFSSQMVNETPGISQSTEKQNNKTRFEKLEELREQVKQKEREKDEIKVKCKKRTFKKRYKLGKQKGGTGKVIGVLVSNTQTRKKVQKDHQLLKKKSSEEIKTFLRNKGLLKVGSDAPIDVLRQMYESCMLTGEVKNTGKGVFIDNYLAEITDRLQKEETEKQEKKAEEQRKNSNESEKELEL